MRPLPAVLLTAAAVAVAVLVLLFGGPPPAAEDSAAGPGAALSADERAALAGGPVDAGELPAGPDPAVDFTNPEAVARAYLVAAYEWRDSDRGRTNRRGVPYSAPGSTPSEVGVLVLDPPPAGQVDTLTITDLVLVAADPDDVRRGYLAGTRVAAGPPGQPGPLGPRLTRYIVLTKLPGSPPRWLVSADTADSPPGGED